MDLYLFYIEWETISGHEHNGFVNATSPQRALALFIKKYSLKIEDYDTLPVIYTVPQNASEAGPLPWDEMECVSDIEPETVLGLAA